MSTISNYDLYADYSTAANYVTANNNSVSTLSSDSNSNFMDILTAETENAAAAEIDDTAGTDTAPEGTDDDDDNDGSEGSDSNTSTDSSNGTTANDSYYRPEINTDTSANDELSFMDMLQLMLLQFQNQTIDDTASTSDMMNQLSMMTNMQAITEMNESITEMTATNAMLYNAQLVGQEVTVAYYDQEGNFVEEVGIVAASGYYDGVPVIFFEGQTSFHLVSSIMAIGKLPETTTPEEEGDGEDNTVDPDIDVDGEDGTAGENGSDSTVGGTGSDTTDPEDSDSSDTILSNDDYAGMTADELLAAANSALG